MDRIDLFVSVSRPDVDLVLGGRRPHETGEEPGKAGARPESTDPDGDWTALLENALKAQARRFGDVRRRNGSMSAREIAVHAELDAEGRSVLADAARVYHLSPRAIHRVLKVARTIADMKGERDVSANDVAEALSFRFEKAFEGAADGRLRDREP